MKSTVQLPAFLLLLLVSLTGCREEMPASRDVVFSGMIANPMEPSVTLSGDSVLQKAALQDGHFQYALSIPRPGFYHLRHDRAQVWVFLRPGMTLTLQADAAQWNKSLLFAGDGSRENNFRHRQDLRRAAWWDAVGTSRQYYLLEEAELRRVIDDIYRPLRDSLAAFAAGGADTTFAALERMRLDLEEATQLLTYPEAHRFLVSAPDFTPSPGYYDFLEKLPLRDERVLSLPAYREFIPVFLRYATREAYPRLSDDPNAQLRAQMERIPVILPGQGGRNLAYWAAVEPLLAQQGVHLSPALIDSLRERITDPVIRSDLEAAYAKWAPLGQGRPAPLFSYPDPAGTVRSLEEFRGRYVYVDVWATWCGPCLAELPYLEQLQKQYQADTRLAFVSVSIDEDVQGWRRFVESHPSQSVQLLANSGWNAQLCRDYRISAIPRFLLIDPEGAIVDADAPPPSSPELRQWLARLLP